MQTYRVTAPEGTHVQEMAHPQELQVLSKAFSGLGVDEKSLVTILGKSHPDHRRSFRKASPHLFIEDERSFERWNDTRFKLLKHEFMRFKNAIMLWAMHPWERDARLIKEALRKGPQAYSIIVEVACTRSSEELLGARKAYHSLFELAVEEDVATHVHGSERKLLVALVSAYRYEGQTVKEDAAKSEAKVLAHAYRYERPNVNEDAAKSEAKVLAHAVKNGDKKNPIEDEEVIRILSTRSKPHLKEVYKHYKEVSGSSIHEELGAANSILKETIECLCNPHTYFSKVLFEAKKSDADKNTKKALTRVVVTRADVDMKEIQKEFNKLHGVSLTQKIDETANGNYKDFLLALITKEN